MKTNQGRYASYKRNTSYRNDRNGSYIDGNTVRKYDIVRELEEKPARRISQQTRKNREKAAHMNLGYVTFLFASLCVAGFVLYGYLTLMTANTAAVAQIASMENQLNSMKLDNDEEYSRIMGSVNLEDIKNRAINDLGMQYAQEGQVIAVPNATDDYVRQYKDIP